MFVESFVEMLERNDELAGHVADFLTNKFGDKDLGADLKNLSNEIKRQACAEYIIIGLISRDIKVKDLVAITNAFTAPPQIISLDRLSEISKEIGEDKPDEKK